LDKVAALISNAAETAAMDLACVAFSQANEMAAAANDGGVVSGHIPSSSTLSPIAILSDFNDTRRTRGKFKRSNDASI
jgi:hypothetical protein